MKRTRARLRWMITIAALINYALLAFWAVPQLEAMSSIPDTQPFDLRFIGYGYADAVDYIASLSTGGLAFYLSEWRILDSIFPLLLTLTFLNWSWVLLARRGMVLRMIFLVIGFSYGVFDLLENAAVARMLEVAGGVENLTPMMVAEANRWTLLKFAVFAISVLGIVYGLILRLFQRG